MVELKEKRLRKSLSEAKNGWQGQKDLNPRHAVLEWLYRARKAHRYTDFEPFLPLQNIIDAILMLLVILKKKYGEYRAKVLL